MCEVTQKNGSLSSGGEVIERDFIRVVFQKGFPSAIGINGCRVEDVLDVALERLHDYQNSPLACIENEDAIESLLRAKRALHDRVVRRREQGVYNTNQQHKTIRTEDVHEDFSATGS